MLRSDAAQEEFLQPTPAPVVALCGGHESAVPIGLGGPIWVARRGARNSDGRICGYDNQERELSARRGGLGEAYRYAAAPHDRSVLPPESFGRVPHGTI